MLKIIYFQMCLILRLNHVFNIYHDYAPQYLHQNFIKVSDSHVYNTRGSTYGFTVRAIKSCESESSYHNTILDWNNQATRQCKINKQQGNLQTVHKKHIFWLPVSLKKQTYFTIFKISVICKFLWYSRYDQILTCLTLFENSLNIYVNF